MDMLPGDHAHGHVHCAYAPCICIWAAHRLLMIGNDGTTKTRREQKTVNPDGEMKKMDGFQSPELTTCAGCAVLLAKQKT